MSSLHTAAKGGLALLLAWAALSSLWAFTLMGVDKARARKGKFRIPEKRLFLAAALGGAPGAILGMRVFRHKTLHRPFTIGMPALLLLNLAVYSLLIYLLVNA
ncbi:MAG: DUF1294 domain-containing protein [Candidatus Pelethousia sp.]|nr:DUF1294 domain-containing protein [Candidatus Pelethousia sp.]